MVDALVLEWEGVIAETADARREALRAALADAEIFLDAGAYALLCDGRSTFDAAEAVLAHAGRSDPTAAELIALHASRHFAARFGKGFVLVPGAREFILRAQLAAPIAIVTTATRSETEFVLRLAELESAVSTIVSADDRMRVSSRAAEYELALSQLSRRRPQERDRTIALAPTATAIRAARESGMRTIAVGAPAHVAVEADGVLEQLDGATMLSLARLAGIGSAETPA